MLHWIRRFGDDDDGAVTVDWVVLTAALVALGLAAMLAVTDATTDTAAGIGAAITAVDAGS